MAVLSSRETSPSQLFAGDMGDVKDYWQLLKPRVMSLVVFIGFAGLVAAPGHIHPALALTTILCIAIGAGAAGCINMWYERDIDAVMSRTKNRPIPAGRIEPGAALGFGVSLALGSVVVQGLAVNILSAALLAFSILFYVFVYTIWLKRRTPQNIVIGGASGAFPPIIGWAAVMNGIDAMPLAMFLLVFLWTPPHFWALALYKSQDYARAGIPMLPVVAGAEHTKKQIWLYSLSLLPASLLPFYLGGAGMLYAFFAAFLSALFALFAWRVLRAPQESAEKYARLLFGYSIVYLFLIFTALIMDAGF